MLKLLDTTLRQVGILYRPLPVVVAGEGADTNVIARPVLTNRHRLLLAADVLGKERKVIPFLTMRSAMTVITAEVDRPLVRMACNALRSRLLALGRDAEPEAGLAQILRNLAGRTRRSSGAVLRKSAERRG